MINNKYTIKAVSILLSATLIYACNEKTEIPEYNYTSDRIVVKTEVEGQTKAGYEGTTALPSEFVMDIIQGNNQNYNYSLVRMTKGNVNGLSDNCTERAAGPLSIRISIRKSSIAE